MTPLGRLQWLIIFSLSVIAFVDFNRMPRFSTASNEEQGQSFHHGESTTASFITPEIGGRKADVMSMLMNSLKLAKTFVRFLPESAVGKELALFVKENAYQGMQLFVFISALMHAFAVPGWVVRTWEMTMASFFPFYSSLLCLILGRVIGATVAYYASALITSKTFKNDERDRLEYLQQLLRKYGESKQLAFITRLEMNGDELFPQSFINYAAPFVNVPVTDVIAGSAVAAIPQSARVVTNSRLYPVIYSLQGLQSFQLHHLELLFIAAVLYFVPDRLCKSLTRDFSADLKTTKSWAKKLDEVAVVPTMKLGKISTVSLGLEAAGALAGCAASATCYLPTVIWTVFAFVGRYTKALAVPSWVPPLSLTSIALAFGDDSDYLEDEDLEVNEALRRLAHGGHDDSEDDRLPGDHRHLLYEDMDPCYDGKYCPDLQKSDMRDSVTEVTPYSIKDRADLMGLGLESGSDNDEGAKKKGNLTFLDNFDIPDWRDENYYATDSPKVNQFVRFVEADDYEDGERPKIWQKKWLIEDLMKSSGSSCPYANRLKMKRLQEQKFASKNTGSTTSFGPPTRTTMYNKRTINKAYL
jgi:uncharacterized membrane protein YdjX (TVP38/TMEM64 family)